MKNYRGIKSFDNFSLSAERVDGWLSLTDPRYPGGDAFEIVDCLAVSLSATCNEKTGKVGRTGISRRQGYFLCGSAQLFNREALCQALQIERAKAVQLCDIDLVLESFVQWGVDSFRRLAGNFSCAIWDKREKVLFAVVDHLGVYSFYYRIIKGEYFGFSNRLRNVTRLDKVRIDDEYLLAYLLNCYQDSGKTVYRDISALPPGCYLTLRKESIEVQRYWQPAVNDASLPKRAVGESGDAARDLIIEAVADRVSPNQTNGILLSGGLDSSAIGCIANSILKQSGSRLVAFSKVHGAGSNGKERDERDFIRTVAEWEEILVEFVSEVAFTGKKLLHEYFRSQSCFPLNPFIFLSRPLYQRAAEGCTTLFTGFGGDETLSTEGLNSLPLLLKQFCWRDFLENLGGVAKRYNLPPVQIFKRFVLRPMLPDVCLRFHRGIRGLDEDRSLGNGFIHKQILSSPFASHLLTSKYGYISDDFLDPRQELCSRLSASYFRPFFDLSEYLDDIFGVTQVFPFLDIRIIEFMLSVHPREFLKEGMTRSVLRRSIAGFVPDEIRLRKDKIPFNVGVPFARCLVESRPLFEEIFHSTQSSVWQLIDRDLLGKKFAELQRNDGTTDAGRDNRMALEIGRCMNVAAFCQWHEVRSFRPAGADEDGSEV